MRHPTPIDEPDDLTTLPDARAYGTVRACLSALVTIAIAGMLIDAFLVRGLWVRMVVCGVSMGEELEGRRVLVNRSAFLWRSPRRFETVVLRSPDDPELLCVKRVVGLPGEVVEIVEGGVYIDGAAARTAKARGGTYAGGPETQYRLGREEYFLLGDNRPRSLDSRVWSRRGGVRKGMLLGPALAW
jgi:signal peptidase I